MTLTPRKVSGVIEYRLARPVFFLLIMITVMALAIYGLLTLGPPTQWAVS